MLDGGRNISISLQLFDACTVPLTSDNIVNIPCPNKSRVPKLIHNCHPIKNFTYWKLLSLSKSQKLCVQNAEVLALEMDSDSDYETTTVESTSKSSKLKIQGVTLDVTAVSAIENPS